MKRFLTWSAVILVAVIWFLAYWLFYNTYSEGNRSGILQKFSKKGNIFKTYEGELVMSSIASTSNVAIASEKFFFSVVNDSIATALFEMEGKKVTVHYEEKRKALPWQGDTKYVVNSVREVVE